MSNFPTAAVHLKSVTLRRAIFQVRLHLAILAHQLFLHPSMLTDKKSELGIRSGRACHARSAFA